MDEAIRQPGGPQPSDAGKGREGMIFEYKLVRVKDVYMGQGAFGLLRTVDYTRLEAFSDKLKAKVDHGSNATVFEPPVLIHTQRGLAALSGWDKIEWARKALEPELYAIVAEPDELPA